MDELPQLLLRQPQQHFGHHYLPHELVAQAVAVLEREVRRLQEGVEEHLLSVARRRGRGGHPQAIAPSRVGLRLGVVLDL